MKQTLFLTRLPNDLKWRLTVSSQASRAIKKVCTPTLLIGTLFLTACQSNEILKATSEYGELSSKAEKMFPVIANDIVSSCIRQSNLRYLDSSGPVQNMTTSRDAARRKCVARESVTAEAMLDIHKLIVLYLNSLAGLAANKSYGKEIVSLGDSIKGLPGMDDATTQQTIDAGTTIATTVSKYLTREYRASKIREAVLQSDKALSQLVYALSTTTFYGYIGGRDSDAISQSSQQAGPGLRQEDYLLNQYYGEPIRQSMLHLPRKPDQGYIEVMLNNAWINEKNTVDERRAFATKYIKLLKDIACDHTQLRLVIENRPDQKPSDVNPYCKRWSDGGLPVSSHSPINDSALETKLTTRLMQYRQRMNALANQYDRVYGRSNKLKGSAF